jgi:hypothetical protein
MLKIGLLVDRPYSDRYLYELVRWAKGRPDIDISHLLVGPRQRDSTSANIAFRLVVSLEKLFHRDHYRTFDLSNLVAEVFTFRFRPEDFEKIRAFDLDVLIDCGSGPLRGDILHASRFGIISFRRAVAAGFWECYYASPQTGFMIQRADEVLVRGSFATRYIHSLNQAELRKRTNAHLKNLLNRIASTGKLPPAANVPSRDSGPRFQPPPRLHQCVVYAIKVAKRILFKGGAKILGLKQRWGISLLSGNWDKAAFWRRTDVKPPRGRFWADPFLCSHNGKKFCFVEDFVYKTGRGHITALEIIGTKVVERGVAVKEPYHLSFPFLFRYQGGLYMCPEASESGQIRIYRCTEFPLKWELHSVLMENVSAADTLLFEKGGRWWMLTSLDQAGTGDHCSELYLFSSDSPLNASWVPHPQNPIRIDPNGGRNAGLVVEGERLFRIAQRQGFDQYGQGLLVYEIKTISESIFTEELVSEINPTFKKGLRGTHHLSTDGKTTAIDHLSYSFVF